MIKILYFFWTLLLLNKILDYYQKSIPNSLKTATTPITGDVIDLNDLEEYNRAPLDNLCIDIGSSKHTRYACAWHKCYIAVRVAIKSNKELKHVVSKLSKFAAKHKNTLRSVKPCVAKKVIFRINNETRWIVFTESIQEAYLLKIFVVLFHLA